MNDVKLGQELGVEIKDIRLDELEGEIRLDVPIDPNDFESCQVVAHCSPTCATEQIK